MIHHVILGRNDGNGILVIDIFQNVGPRASFFLPELFQVILFKGVPGNGRAQGAVVLVESHNGHMGKTAVGIFLSVLVKVLGRVAESSVPDFRSDGEKDNGGIVVGGKEVVEFPQIPRRVPEQDIFTTHLH